MSSHPPMNDCYWACWIFENSSDMSVSFFVRNVVRIFLWNAGNIFIHSLKNILFTFSFDEIQTILGCPHFQKIIRINIWKINVVLIFIWWNADNILSCPHVVRLSVVVCISSIPMFWLDYVLRHKVRPNDYMSATPL